MYTRIEEFFWRFTNKDAALLKYCDTKYNAYASLGFNLLISSLLISLIILQLMDLAGYNSVLAFFFSAAVFSLVRFTYLKSFTIFDSWKELNGVNRGTKITVMVFLKIILASVCFISLVARLFLEKTSLDKRNNGVFNLAKRAASTVISDFDNSSSQIEVYLLVLFISVIIVLIPTLTYLMTDCSYYFRIKTYFDKHGESSNK
jgi:hypothetical protein